MTKVVQVRPEDLSLIWEKILDLLMKTCKVLFPTVVITDVDGTLDESDPRLVEYVRKLQERGVYVMIATGQTVFGRESKGDLAGAVDILIAQGGDVLRVKEGNDETFYIIPLEKPADIIKRVANSLGMTVDELLWGEHIAVNYIDTETKCEMIGIPIPESLTEETKEILALYDGDIVAAVDAMEHVPSSAILEYTRLRKPGIPKERIGVIYWREIESAFPTKIITEMTVVGADLKEYKETFEKNGIVPRIQSEIKDRYTGTRGALPKKHPDIFDIVRVGKKDHIDAMLDVIREESGVTIGIGDQGNDDFLYSTNVSFVVNAAPIGKKGGWDFAISMAEKAFYQNLDDPLIVHVRQGKDGTLGNWVLGLLAGCETFKERVQLCKWLAESEINLQLREFLLRGAPEDNPYDDIDLII